MSGSIESNKIQDNLHFETIYENIFEKCDVNLTGQVKTMDLGGYFYPGIYVRYFFSTGDSKFVENSLKICQKFVSQKSVLQNTKTTDIEASPVIQGCC